MLMALSVIMVIVVASLAEIGSTQCPEPEKFGSSCQHVCHCRNATDCAGKTGACNGECQNGFSGPICQRRNLAFYGNATCSRNGSVEPCKEIADGNKSTCFNLSAPGHRLVLNMKDSSKSVSIHIDRIYPCRYIPLFLMLVNVSNTRQINCSIACQNFYGAGNVFPYSCVERGQMIEINHTLPLGVCEIEAFGCEKGFFGPKCDAYCGHCRNGDGCDEETGTCTGDCESGYTGKSCQNECRRGTYGDNCNHTCPSCGLGLACHHITGNCPTLPTSAIRSVHGPSVGLGFGVCLALSLALVGVLWLMFRERRIPACPQWRNCQESLLRRKSSSQAPALPGEQQVAPQEEARYSHLDLSARNVPHVYEQMEELYQNVQLSSP